MNEPTPQQFALYDALVAVGADDDVATYIAGTDECGCVMPWHTCQMCRGAAKMRNAASDLAELLELADTVKVTMIDGLMIVNAPPNTGGVVIDDIDAGILALDDGGHYREYSQHIGGRTTPLFVAEPVEGMATGPVFVLAPGCGKWEVVENDR